jgi:exopolyphosphatase/pppGpp-phosphohydrolase
MVEETLIEEMRSAIFGVAAFGVRVGVMSSLLQSLYPARLHLDQRRRRFDYRSQSFLDSRRNQAGDVAAEAEDFLHQFRADEGELLSGE